MRKLFFTVLTIFIIVSLAVNVYAEENNIKWELKTPIPKELASSL